ncbi:MAG TPA: HlyD family type I secretion periplasmic adaptor subunit [Dongiaceae bacterium]|nr:HlyD family type I secretion periplasmic adaptor subunit [Dongiaceae bacterium]
MSLTNRDLWIDPSETEREGTRMFGHLLLIAVVLIVATGLIWAHFAVLDEITRGEGKVIPSSQTQVVQSEKGGVILDLKVREGDIVNAGDVVAVIDNTQLATNMAELQQRYFTGLAASARLQAELAGVSDPAEIKFAQDLLDKAPEVAETEKSVFVVRQQQLESQRATLRSQVETKTQELRQIDTKVSTARKSLSIAQEQADILAPLVKTGISSKVDLLRAQQEVQGYQSEISNAEASRAPARAALAEAEAKLKEIDATFRAEAAQQLSQHRAELASVTQLLTGSQKEAGRQNLLSPVYGTVKQIQIHTLGGVLQPAEALMEIVPIEDTLLIEAQIRPQDRGFIAPNQPAKIKITAYDYSIYGGLDAKVEQISADAIENERKELFFRVRLRTDKNYLVGKDGGELQIIPGMTATVDILTGKKTVLDYLLKPILKARDTALSER